MGTLILNSTLIPAVVAFAAAFGICRILGSGKARYFAGSLPFAISFLTGFALLETAALRPSTYWHYLPWLAIAIGIVAPLSFALNRRPIGLWVAIACLSLGAAWLLVPTWTSIKPVRSWYIGGLSAGLFLYWLALDRLNEKASRPTLWCALLLTALNAGILIVVFISLRMGLLGIVAAAAIGGIAAAALLTGEQQILRGLLPVFVVVVGGISFSAGMNDGLPPAALVAVCAAPLTLWIGCIGPITRLPRKWRIVLMAGLIVVPLVAAWEISVASMPTKQAW